MIHSLQEAFTILETQKEGIPFEAIRFIREHKPTKEIEDTMCFSLTHAYDDMYYNEEEQWYYSTPLWYAVVAEKHLSKALIEPVVSLCITQEADWDFLSEQASYLIGLLAQHYPKETMKAVMAAVDYCLAQNSKAPVLFLFDAFAYIDDGEPYKDWFLNTLANPNFIWGEMLVHDIARIGLEEAIPIIKKRLEQQEFFVGDFKEALYHLENGIVKKEKPFCEERGDWEEHYRAFEDTFYESDEEKNYSDTVNFPEILPDEKNLDISSQPITNKYKNIGRNDACPCGSEKKFKKCCLIQAKK